MSLSLAEIKELIAYARAQKIIVLEAGGVRFQFNPVAHDPPSDATSKPATKPEPEDNGFGHHVPE